MQEQMFNFFCLHFHAGSHCGKVVSVCALLQEGHQFNPQFSKWLQVSPTVKKFLDLLLLRADGSVWVWLWLVDSLSVCVMDWWTELYSQPGLAPALSLSLVVEISTQKHLLPHNIISLWSAHNQMMLESFVFIGCLPHELSSKLWNLILSKDRFRKWSLTNNTGYRMLALSSEGDSSQSNSPCSFIWCQLGDQSKKQIKKKNEEKEPLLLKGVQNVTTLLQQNVLAPLPTWTSCSNPPRHVIYEFFKHGVVIKPKTKNRHETNEFQHLTLFLWRLKMYINTAQIYMYINVHIQI